MTWSASSREARPSTSRSAAMPSATLPSGRERVAAARLGEAADERVVGAVEEEHLDAGGPRAAPRRAPRRLRRGRRPRARPPRAPGAAPRRRRRAASSRELGQQQHRQVVDAEEAQRPRAPDGGGLPRAGHAGDEDDAVRVCASGGGSFSWMRGHYSTSSPMSAHRAPAAIALVELLGELLARSGGPAA